jgi:hypothetical protein
MDPIRDPQGYTIPDGIADEMKIMLQQLQG